MEAAPTVWQHTQALVGNGQAGLSRRVTTILARAPPVENPDCSVAGRKRPRLLPPDGRPRRGLRRLQEERGGQRLRQRVDSNSEEAASGHVPQLGRLSRVNHVYQRA